MNAATRSPGSGSVSRRPDLSRRSLLAVLGAVTAGVFAALFFAILASPESRAPGTPLRQSAAIIGALLLLVPFAFSIAKRSGLSASPPAWFVAHVLCGAVGTVLIFVHAAGGNFISPPGVVLIALLFIVVQGLWARAYLSDDIATLFAARISSFRQADPVLREQIARIIEQKRQLLARLDPLASEALFSPDLRHGLRHPWLSLRYARLAATEARLVGRREAGLKLALWRRVHIAVAYLFVIGVILHVLLVTFFAGYVAGGDPIYWWHLAAWGGQP